MLIITGKPYQQERNGQYWATPLHFHNLRMRITTGDVGRAWQTYAPTITVIYGFMIYEYTKQKGLL